MTKQELEHIIDESMSKIYGSTKEEIEENMRCIVNKYSSETHVLSNENAVALCLIESAKYTNRVLYSVLSKFLETP